MANPTSIDSIADKRMKLDFNVIDTEMSFAQNVNL